MLQYCIKKKFQSQNQLYNVGCKQLYVLTIWKKNKTNKWTNKVSECLYESIITHLAQLQ